MKLIMIRRMVAVALFAVSAASGVVAQDVDRTKMWAAVGAGAGLPTSGGDGIGNLVQLVLQKNAHHVAIRGVVLHDLDRATKEIGEVGLLYGRARALNSRTMTLAAGVSGVAFDTCPDDDDSCFAIGIPLVVEASLLSGKYIGLGVQAFGNLNRKASYVGGVLFLQLGRLK